MSKESVIFLYTITVTADKVEATMQQLKSTRPTLRQVGSHSRRKSDLATSPSVIHMIGLTMNCQNQNSNVKHIVTLPA